jgi:hypothetical protein
MKILWLYLFNVWFPNKTAQETIDSLEVVRLVFQIIAFSLLGISLPTSRPVGKNPDEFQIKITGPKFKGFAERMICIHRPNRSSPSFYIRFKFGFK